LMVRESAMSTVGELIVRVRDGDADAYDAVVRRFQDMAVGYGYSILRDFQLAEDAAQEAFFEAHRCLASLREPEAFPGWFRRIVFKHCDRIMRRAQIPLVAMDAVQEPSTAADQSAVLESSEAKERLMRAIDILPDHERETLTLYYISGYSQSEVAEFLGVPVTTVKKRLFSARGRLRDLLVDAAGDTLRERRPSRDELFSTRVVAILKAARAGDVDAVKTLLEADPRLSIARDPLGNTAMIIAVNSGQDQIAELLSAAGIKSDIFEAAAIGNTDRVCELLTESPALVQSYSPEGFTALGLAAHFGHVDAARVLIGRGADVNAIAKNELGVTPLHAALFGRKTEAACLLIEHGADVNAKRGGHGIPRAGWTPLHYAASFGFGSLVALLVSLGADCSLTDERGKTPRAVAKEAGEKEVESLLLKFESRL
jgi:RNA polymerase sigma factor (sigma-70 family)